jgi:Carboxypeptidase regulatory-like domain
LSQASGYGGLTRLPSAEGEHPEWQFAKMGAYAFLIETHTQFQPSYTSAVNEANLVWPGILSVLERPVSLSGHVTDAGTGTPLTATIELPNLTFANGESNSSGGSYGAYHMFLPPGTYDVRFSAAGYLPAVRQVTVTTASAVVANVQLTSATLPPSAPQNVRIIR